MSTLRRVEYALRAVGVNQKDRLTFVLATVACQRYDDAVRKQSREVRRHPWGADAFGAVFSLTFFVRAVYDFYLAVGEEPPPLVHWHGGAFPAYDSPWQPGFEALSFLLLTCYWVDRAVAHFIESRRAKS